MAINFDKVPAYIRKEIDYPKKVIRSGMRNMSVQRIQEWLQIHHCRTAIDGDFGPATASCVRDFQKLQGLSQTGRVNADTWNALVAPMRTALTAPPGIEDKSDPESVLLVANQHVDQHAIEVGGPNSGPWVRLYCEGRDGPSWAWCAGFVSLIMQQAYFYRGKKPPIKGSVSCDILSGQAQKAGLFVSGRSVASGETPWSRFGGSALFLRRRTSTDWTHTGVATESEGTRQQLIFSTIEGNTNDEGSREGFEACRRKRGVAGDKYDFIAFN